MEGVKIIYKEIDGMRRVQLDDDKWAFIDKNGKLQNGRYKDAYSYSDGFALVELDDGEWAFINKKGKLQDGRYKDAYSYNYNEGFARVQLDDGKYTFIDKNGNIYLSKQEWLVFIEKDPTMYKLIPPHRFDDENFIDSIEQTIKNKYISDINKVDSASESAKEELAVINSEFDDFCKLREEKMKSIEEYKKEEEYKLLEKKEIDGIKTNLTSKIKTFRSDNKDRG